MKKLVLNFCFIVCFVAPIFPMGNEADIEAQKVKIKAKNSKKEFGAKWFKIYGTSLILTASMTVAASFLVGSNNILSDLAQNALAEGIADSMDFQDDENKSPLYPSNFLLWLLKLSVLYFPATVGNHRLNFAFAVAMFHVTREHFIDERNKKDEELQETLSKILSDPKFAQFRKQMAEKTIEVIVHNPEIVAQQIHDPILTQNLKAISADPKLMEQFQQTFEAQLAMFMRPVIEQAAQPILPAPAPACLLDPEDDGSGTSSASAPSTSSSEAKGKRSMLQDHEFQEDPFKSQLKQNEDFLLELMQHNAHHLYDLMREEYKKDLVQMTLAIKLQQEKEAQEKAAMLAQKAQEKKAQDLKSSWWPWHKSYDKKTQSPVAAALVVNESGSVLLGSSVPIEIVIDAIVTQDTKMPRARQGTQLSDPSTGSSVSSARKNSHTTRHATKPLNIGNAMVMDVPMHDKTSSSSSDSGPLDNLKRPLLGGSDDEV